MLFKKNNEEINSKFPINLDDRKKCKKLGVLLEKNICPGCESKNEIYDGPCGGMAINVVCRKCRRWFWLAPVFGAYFLRQEASCELVSLDANTRS